MASIKVKADVTEVRVIEKGGVTLELSTEEAEGLAMLLRGGVGSGTLGLLGLRSVCDSLRLEGFGEADKHNHLKWSQTAQRSTL